MCNWNENPEQRKRAGAAVKNSADEWEGPWTRADQPGKPFSVCRICKCLLPDTWTRTS